MAIDKYGNKVDSPSVTRKPDTMEGLIDLLAPGGIERQEAQGQQELVNSSVLPSELNWAIQEDFEKVGFVFGDEVSGDPLFRHTTLPEGWKKQSSDHSMWSYVVDPRGIRRVSVFYKAAFYDRKAFMGLTTVGHEISNAWIYGDETELSLHPELTVEELAEIRGVANQYVDAAARNANIYGDKMERVEMLIAALDDISIEEARKKIALELEERTNAKKYRVKMLHDSGVSLRDISYRLDIPETTVRQILDLDN